MAVEIKRVSYAWNSALEDQGQPSCFLDVIVTRDAEMIVDIHKSFKSRSELLSAMEEVIPVLGPASDSPEGIPSLSEFAI